MNAKRLLHFFSYLPLFLGFWGCTDHRNQFVTPGVARLRVRTISQENPNSTTLVSAFKYDAQGRLSLISAHQTPDSSLAPVENTIFQYDGQNRLTQARHSVVRRGSNAETYTLTYNAAGQLAQLANLPSTFSVIPQYNSANQVSGYSKQLSVGGLQSSGGGSFTFTANNLPVASEVFSVVRLGGPPLTVYSRSIRTTSTFDDKINPFYGTFIIPAPGVFLPPPGGGGVGAFGPFYTYYGGIDNPSNLSQNNVTSATSGGVVTTYSYLYNAANLPTKRITATGNSVMETLYVDYETY